MKIRKILVAEDDPLIRKFLKEALERKQKEALFAENGAIAIELLGKEDFDLIITDMKMPKKTGLDVLLKAKKTHPLVPVVLMTAFGTIENAVEATRLGAFHYLIKPFSFEALEAVLEKGERHLSLLHENASLKQQVSAKSFPDLLAHSPGMKKILRDIQKIAKANASVFITGESGTGKEVVAQTIHAKSPRSTHPFIKVNCAAIPDTLIESEFFGHEKGAFTGAQNRRLGRFELADKGTLLLDEVTEIPLSLQPKLLRAIQEQEFERVGAMKSISVDIRFIATSNRNMKEAIDTKVFREDLFYRLNVVPIHIPPLRERQEDTSALADYFLQHFCEEHGKKPKVFSPSVKDHLLSYHWPGNVRELANVIERVVVMDFSPTVDPEHLYLDPFLKKEKQKTTLKELEKQWILQALEENEQNRTKAAEQLGISVRTLRNKLSDYALEEKQAK